MLPDLHAVHRAVSIAYDLDEAAHDLWVTPDLLRVRLALGTP